MTPVPGRAPPQSPSGESVARGPCNACISPITDPSQAQNRWIPFPSSLAGAKHSSSTWFAYRETREAEMGDASCAGMIIRVLLGLFRPSTEYSDPSVVPLSATLLAMNPQYEVNSTIFELAYSKVILSSLCAWVCIIIRSQLMDFVGVQVLAAHAAPGLNIDPGTHATSCWAACRDDPIAGCLPISSHVASTLRHRLLGPNSPKACVSGP